MCSLLQVRCMAGILHPLVLLEAWEAGLGKALSCHEGAQDGPMGGGRGRPVLRAPSHIPPEQMSSTLALEMLGWREGTTSPCPHRPTSRQSL